jgi:hypothetical protein
MRSADYSLRNMAPGGLLTAVLLLLTFFSFWYELGSGIRGPSSPTGARPNIACVFFYGRAELEVRIGPPQAHNIEFVATPLSSLAWDEYPAAQLNMFGIRYFNGPWLALPATKLIYVQFPMYYPISLSCALLWISRKAPKHRKGCGFDLVEVAAAPIARPLASLPLAISRASPPTAPRSGRA